MVSVKSMSDWQVAIIRHYSPAVEDTNSIAVRRVTAGTRVGREDLRNMRLCRRAFRGCPAKPG